MPLECVQEAAEGRVVKLEQVRQVQMAQHRPDQWVEVGGVEREDVQVPRRVMARGVALGDRQTGRFWVYVYGGFG